ncbi:hypothetical protein CTAYLR_008512 [Chrysophaeum taylorii]|uniref:Major facilitator superfamily (MFS) profile domain-containing protein n=1 Tax=Chrysophaeum taylorii TaxID=2483200 RepID=A0AAD7XGS3_9STRA|nr:hypothetical protein CTAYLR_008512 [Chrysophaeum taylorii]
MRAVLFVLAAASAFQPETAKTVTTPKFNGLRGRGRAAVAQVEETSTAGPLSIQSREALMDDKLALLGVSRYQALMAIFVAMVYAADGAEVMVMSLVSRTLVEKWALADWKQGLLGMSVYSGMFTGGLTCGPVADGKGRSFTLITATAMIALFGVLSAYAPNLELLCLARFIAGVGMGASLPVSSSLLQETVPKAWKGGLACLVFSGFNLGELFAAKAGVLAFNRADPSTWLFLVAALPAIATFVVSLIVPESPRFLANNGNVRGVRRWFVRAARINGKNLQTILGPEPDETAAALCAVGKPPKRAKKTEPKPQIRSPVALVADKFGGLFVKELRLRTLVLWVLWMAANAAFYGSIFSLPEALRFSKTAANDVNFDVARGISQVSAYQSLAFLFFMPLVALGVKYSFLFPLAFAGGFLALFSAMLSTNFAAAAPLPGHLVACLAFAKFFYNGVFMMLYPLTGESYPTTTRATGTAIAGTVGRVCTILVAPVCTRLQQISALLPYQVFIVTSALAFLASLLL